jgi:uncharacterized membrane protein
MTRDTGRVEAFSDGVIAVAITLLILNIHLPNLSTGLAAAVTPSQLAMYLSYITSFLVIGIFWANHHNMYQHIEYTDHVLLLINNIFLLLIVTIPFGTSLLSQNLDKPEAQHIAAAIYSLILLLNGIAFNGIWWYTAWRKRLIYKNLDPLFIRSVTRNYLIGLPLYLVSFVLSLWSVDASLFLYIVVAIIYSLPLMSSTATSPHMYQESKGVHHVPANPPEMTASAHTIQRSLD